MQASVAIKKEEMPFLEYFLVFYGESVMEINLNITPKIFQKIADALIALKTARKVDIDLDKHTITAYKMPLQGKEIIRIDIKEA